MGGDNEGRAEGEDEEGEDRESKDATLQKSPSISLYLPWTSLALAMLIQMPKHEITQWISNFPPP